MNNKEKPVWRINTGAGVPSDLGDEVVLKSGKHRKTRDHNFGVGDLRDGRWDKTGIGSDIYAYQTTRTKAAKYHRVQCDWCVSGYELTGISTCDVCRKCNGHGFYWERNK
jgi:hypothetical protein